DATYEAPGPLPRRFYAGRDNRGPRSTTAFRLGGQAIRSTNRRSGEASTPAEVLRLVDVGHPSEVPAIGVNHVDRPDRTRGGWRWRIDFCLRQLRRWRCLPCRGRGRRNLTVVDSRRRRLTWFGRHCHLAREVQAFAVRGPLNTEHGFSGSAD